jgi:hypothetical protein
MSQTHHKIESVQQPPVEQVKKTPTMKLVVRSEYWGRLLEGRMQREQRNPQSPYRVITCQAVLRKPGKYWGCCAHSGSRVLELNESHFMEHDAGNWELYHVRSLPVENNVYHELFLLPHNQTCINTDDKVHRNQWTFMGSISAGMVRMDLEPFLKSLLQPNDSLGYHFHHVHIQVMMDHALDREMDDKIKKKARLSRQQTKNKIIKTNRPPPSPMIAHVVSHDASSIATADLSQQQSINNTSTSIPASAHNKYDDGFPFPSFPHFVHGEAVHPRPILTSYPHPHLYTAAEMLININNNNNNYPPMGPAQQFCMATGQNYDGWQGGWQGESFVNTTNTFGSFDGSWETPASFSSFDTMPNYGGCMMGSEQPRSSWIG